MNKILNGQNFNFFELIKGLRRERKFFQQLFYSGLIIILLINFLSDKLYVSDSIISPVSDSISTSAVSSVIAGSIGLGSEISIDPQTIFNSEALRKNIIYKKRSINQSNLDMNLIEYWDIDKVRWYNPLDLLSIIISKISQVNNSDIEKRITEKKAIDILDDRITLAEDFYTNEIKISVKMEDRTLAQDINNDIINYINEFIINAKNQNADSEIFYLNQRISEVKIDLENFENNLQVFKEDNIGYLNSPKLLKDFTRIARDVTLTSEVLIRLQTQVELEKINTLSRVSNFVTVDSPTFPAKKVWPRLSILLVYLLVLVLFLGITVVIYKDSKLV